MYHMIVGQADYLVNFFQILSGHKFFEVAHSSLLDPEQDEVTDNCSQNFLLLAQVSLLQLPKYMLESALKHFWPSVK